MNLDDLNKKIEEVRESHLQSLIPWRETYLKNGVRSEDGFEILEQIPGGVEWVLEDDMLKMKGNQKGLQEMTMIIQAFAHDYDTVGLFHENFLLLKHHESTSFEDLVVIAMPDEAWAFWGGKMADVAWEHDVTETSFNSIGFFEETLPLDLGISMIEK